MIQVVRFLLSVGVLIVGCLLGLMLPVSPTAAQKKTLHAGEGKEKLVPDKDWSKASEVAEARRFAAMRKGDQSAKGGDDVLEHGAQWYAYRITYPDYQEPKPGGRSMHDILKEALDQILDPRGQGGGLAGKPLNANQKLFIDEFGKRFAARLREVAKNPKVIARLNAAMVLAKLAATGQEDAAEVLTEIIQDGQENDGVKLYAFRGLKELFASGRGDSPFPPQKKELEGKCVRALLDYVGREPTLPAEATPEELAAIHYVRTEAVKALGYTRLPALCELVKKQMKVDRPTALVLLKVLRNDGFKTEPSIGEQVAAAIGICQLQYRECHDYQADYAAYHIGRFLVEFFTKYNEQKDQKRERWKEDAVLLLKALGDWKANLAGPPAHDPGGKYADQLVAQATGALEDISAGKTSVDPTKLSAWLDQNPPKNTTVYKSLANSVVKQ
jgi:hypothetical protein